MVVPRYCNDVTVPMIHRKLAGVFHPMDQAL